MNIAAVAWPLGAWRETGDDSARPNPSPKHPLIKPHESTARIAGDMVAVFLAIPAFWSAFAAGEPGSCAGLRRLCL
jgi:hypothetical protein